MKALKTEMIKARRNGRIHIVGDNSLLAEPPISNSSCSVPREQELHSAIVGFYMKEDIGFYGGYTGITRNTDREREREREIERERERQRERERERGSGIYACVYIYIYIHIYMDMYGLGFLWLCTRIRRSLNSCRQHFGI